jgi:isoleucyl-tRNA synthetase
VQQARRDAGLDVSDRIALTLAGDTDVQGAVTTHRDLITRETLATRVEVRPELNGAAAVPVGQGQSVFLEVAKL